MVALVQVTRGFGGMAVADVPPAVLGSSATDMSVRRYAGTCSEVRHLNRDALRSVELQTSPNNSRCTRSCFPGSSGHGFPKDRAMWRLHPGNGCLAV